MRHQRKQNRARGRSSCAQIRSDDFDDPTRFFDHSTRKRDDRKAKQLCRQVFRTLGGALEGCADETLRELTVCSVEPAPDATRLLVTVCPPAGGGPPQGAEILRALWRARGMLRREVASAVVRKRAPELAFQLTAVGTFDAPPPGDAAGEEVRP